MNIYDTAHKLAEEIKRSDECVQLAELRERAYADETNRLLLEEYKRLQVQLQMSMVGAAGVRYYRYQRTGRKIEFTV